MLDVTEGAEERIVELMLGQVAARARAGRGDPRRRRGHARPGASRPARGPLAGRRHQAQRRLVRPPRRARCSASSRSRARARTSCSRSSPAPGARRRRDRGRRRAGPVRPPERRHPRGPPVRPGEPGRGAPHAALRPREHRAPGGRAVRRWGPIRMGAERARVKRAIDRLQIDTRAPSPRSAACRAATSRR